jgi:hypothetical protein
MANIPPLSPERTPHHLQAPATDDGWVMFNLLFVLAVSAIVNIALVLRLAAFR